MAVGLLHRQYLVYPRHSLDAGTSIWPVARGPEESGKCPLWEAAIGRKVTLGGALLDAPANQKDQLLGGATARELDVLRLITE